MGSPLGPQGNVNRPKEVAGGFVTISAGSNHGCGLQADGSAFCWGKNGDGRLGIGTISDSVGLPVRVAAPTFSAISAGGGLTCGLQKGTGFAWCWGDNEVNQLGQPSTTLTSPTPMRALPPMPGAPPVVFVSISAGADHACAIDTNAAIWCWGNNTAWARGY